jgi:hypothetical protein
MKGAVNVMDNFMDKLAQKFSAQEIIKANSEAEAEEMKKLKLQVSEYEKILQEMRKLNYKNTELSEKLNLEIGENAEKIESMREDEHKLLNMLRDITDEQTRNREAALEQKEEERLERERAYEVKQQTDTAELVELIESKFQNSDDFVHKENVKVYRNVQAVVTDELKKYSDMLQEQQSELKKKTNTAICIGIVATVASICNLVVWAAVILITSGIF